jgi:UDP-2-acetamido-2-deoxy-ribo-hexuluronate aminotransferase
LTKTFYYTYKNKNINLNMQFINLKKQQERIKKNIEKNISNVLSHGKYIKGDEVEEIENRLADFICVRYAVGCASGTDALQLALMALDLKPDDEVITTPFTFFATGEIVALLGLKPVFIDIEPDSYNIDASKIKRKITNKTKAIMPVSLYGQCSDMDEINRIALKYNIKVIEDGAQSFGAEYKGKKSCNLSDIGTTSFFPSKPLGCYGDGGMIFTSDKNLSDNIRKIANHGQEKRYYHTMIGINSRLDTLQAAVLLAKMEIFEDEIEKRHKIGKRYTEKLKNYVKTPVIKEDRTSVYAQYTIEVQNRDKFCEKMHKKGIPTAIHYPVPLHFQPVFKNLNFKNGDFPVAEKVSKHVVSLPMHPYLEEKDQDLIVEKVKESF